MTAPATHAMHGFPRGWFVVAFSDELPPRGVLPLRYFGRALVLFRGEDGVARALDAHCPHLGADLGAGGVVRGNGLRCPFHHWVFDEAGLCVEIPRCDRIPRQARLGVWPVCERNHMIFIWYHRDGAPPDFDVPRLRVETEEGWLPWRHARMRIRTHSREIVENVVDVQHFPTVHGTEITTFENEFVDERAVQRTTGVAYPRGGGKDRFELEATYHGPGYQITDMRGWLHSMLVNAHTMIDDHTLDLRFGVSIKPRGSSQETEGFLDAYVKNLTTGFMEDVQIWENKVWRDQPLLSSADGPIMRLRRWYAQFYQ